MSLAVEGPTQPHPRAARARESGRGAIALAISLVAFAGLVCAAAALSLADRLPTTLDQYLPTRAGQSSLYRITYVDGSQGFATSNIVKPSTDSISYARVYATGQAIQQHTSYTNWQGAGQAHTLDDYFARDCQQLVQVAQRQAANTTVFQPSLSVWTPSLLASRANP